NGAPEGQLDLLSRLHCVRERHRVEPYHRELLELVEGQAERLLRRILVIVAVAARERQQADRAREDGRADLLAAPAILPTDLPRRRHGGPSSRRLRGAGCYRETPSKVETRCAGFANARPWGVGPRLRGSA